MPCCRRIAVLSPGLACLMVLSVPGCDDPSLAGKDIPSVEVRTVESHGRVLDQQASPEEVVFVLLQAVREDVQAARNLDKEAMKEALKLEASLAACEWMYANYKRTLQRMTLPVEVSSDVAVFKLVRMWAPLLAHYAEFFDRDYESAVEHMVAYRGPDQNDAVVLYDVPPTAGESPATVKLELRRERDYWRIRRISFSRTRAAALRAGQAARVTPTSSEQPPTEQ